MTTKRIEREKNGSFTFYVDKQSDLISNKRCTCGRWLDIEYIKIIHTLKKKGWLDECYEPICCICYLLKQADEKSYELFKYNLNSFGGNEEIYVYDGRGSILAKIPYSIV